MNSFISCFHVDSCSFQIRHENIGLSIDIVIVVTGHICECVGITPIILVEVVVVFQIMDNLAHDIGYLASDAR